MMTRACVPPSLHLPVPTCPKPHHRVCLSVHLSAQFHPFLLTYRLPPPRRTTPTPGLPILDAQMSAAPAAPPPCARDRPAHIVAELQSITRTLQISGLHKYRAWTFNGTVRLLPEP